MTSSAAKMPNPSLLMRIGSRATRTVKFAFGVESYLKTEDRRVLEQIIFPFFLNASTFRNVLFVGCHWYTNGYNKWFEEKTNYWTIEIDPSRRRFGAKQHIVDRIQNLRSHFGRGALDLIVCNGVFGWGLDSKADVEQAFSACFECLAKDGVLIIGWDDVDERRPFYLGECESLRAFSPYMFPPLGTAEYVTGTSYQHTFTFYIKSEEVGPVPPSSDLDRGIPAGDQP